MLTAVGTRSYQFLPALDNRTRYTERKAKEAMLDSDVQVSAMGIFDLRDSRKLTREEPNGPQLLTDLAEKPAASTSRWAIRTTCPRSAIASVTNFAISICTAKSKCS